MGGGPKLGGGKEVFFLGGGKYPPHPYGTITDDLHP